MHPQARVALALPILGIAQAAIPPARAMDYALTQIDAPPAQGVERNLGLSVLSVDRSPGAHRRESLVLPLIEYYGASGWFASTLAGLGWNLSHDKAWQFGPRLTPVLPRAARDTAAPEHARDVGVRLERGAFLNYAPQEWLMLQSGFRQGAGARGLGLLADVGLTVGAPLGPRWLAAAAFSRSWANNFYNRAYFGDPQHPENAPGNGWTNAATDLLLQGEPTPGWTLILDLGRTSARVKTAAAMPGGAEWLFFVGAEHRL